MISSNLQFAVEYAKTNELPKNEVLSVVRDMLASSIDQVYGEMQRIDRKLRGDGCPRSVEMQEVSEKSKAMHAFLNKQYQAKLVRPKWSFERFFREHQFLFWVVPYVIGFFSPWVFKKFKSRWKVA